MFETCDPKKYICSVEQWFKEKKRLAKLSPIKAIEEAKPVFSEKLFREIEAAEIRERKVKPYTYSDLIFLKGEIENLENKLKQHPSRSAWKELEKKKELYRDILSVENRLFKKAVREKNIKKVEEGIYMRLPDRIVYSITTNVPEIVELYFKGLDVEKIHLKHPEIPKEDIQEIVHTLKKYEK